MANKQTNTFQKIYVLISFPTRLVFPFYMFVFDGTYYGLASSVCLSRLVGRNVSARILQLDSIDHHEERKMLFVLQDRWSKVKVVLSVVGKRCRHDTDWTISFRFLQLDTIDQLDDRKMPIVFSRSEVKGRFIIK